MGECIGDGRVHGPSNTLSWPQETKIMIPDTLPDSCSGNVVVMLFSLTETVQQWGRALGPVPTNDVAVDGSHFGEEPKQGRQTATPTPAHLLHSLTQWLTKQLRPNLNSVSSRSGRVCCARSRSRHSLQHCEMGRINDTLGTLSLFCSVSSSTFIISLPGCRVCLSVCRQ